VQKTTLRDAIVQQLREELARQASAAEMARDEAISEESRAENKWDTHSQEAAYLAEGQAKLALEIGASIELYGTMPLPVLGSGEPVAVGAFVQLEPATVHPRRSLWYFIGPRAGGMELELENKRILVLTPQSPLGRQLVGKQVGDTVLAPGRGAPIEHRIVSIE